MVSTPNISEKATPQLFKLLIISLITIIIYVDVLYDSSVNIFRADITFISIFIGAILVFVCRKFARRSLPVVSEKPLRFIFIMGLGTLILVTVFRKGVPVEIWAAFIFLAWASFLTESVLILLGDSY